MSKIIDFLTRRKAASYTREVKLSSSVIQANGELVLGIFDQLQRAHKTDNQELAAYYGEVVSLATANFLAARSCAAGHEESQAWRKDFVERLRTNTLKYLATLD